MEKRRYLRYVSAAFFVLLSLGIVLAARHFGGGSRSGKDVPSLAEAVDGGRVLGEAIGEDVYMALDMVQAKDLISKHSNDTKFKIIDVRTEEEFAAGHIEGAINFDLDSRDFLERANQSDKKGVYLIYCRTNVRSAKAAAVLGGLGFANVYQLKEGYVGYLAQE